MLRRTLILPVLALSLVLSACTVSTTTAEPDASTSVAAAPAAERAATSTGKAGAVGVVDRVLPEIDHRTARDAPVYVQVMLLDAHQPGTMRPDEAAVFDTDEGRPNRKSAAKSPENRFAKVWVELPPV